MSGSFPSIPRSAGLNLQQLMIYLSPLSGELPVLPHDTSLSHRLCYTTPLREGDKERYELTWAGKQAAKKTAAEGVYGRTLKYVPEDSKNPDTTENLYIEGDNLEILKLLQNSYMGKIKMIYIDPPYNTGKDFVYLDKFSVSEVVNAEAEGDVSEEGERYKVNSNTSGKYHANWLSMMYPRLRLAKNLLKDDGIIFVSIDDNEVHNLREMMYEIFGEDNFVAELPTIMNLKGNQDQFGFAGTHEYTLVFAKNKDFLKLGHLNIIDEEISNWEMDDWGYYKKGANLKATGVNAPREKRPNLYFPLYITESNSVSTVRKSNNDIEIFPITNDKEMSWRWEQRKFEREPYNVIVEISSSNGVSIYKKQRPELNDIPSKKPKSLLYKPQYSSGNGTNQLKELFGIDRILDHPKPLDLIRDLIEITYDSESVVLDFFSGSATTAHAVMQLNAEDGGNRKYIMVQIPEECPPTSEAAKAGYETIADIGKERIRRAGEKIKEEAGENAKNLDIGFRVFKTADTNVRWIAEENGMKASQTQLDGTTKSGKDRRDFMPDATDIDVAYEILLRQYDIPLSAPMETLSDIGKRTYCFADAVVVCLEEVLTEEIIDKIAAIEPMPHKVVFRDSAFGRDINLKLNTMARFDAMMKKHSEKTKQPYTIEFL